MDALDAIRKRRSVRTFESPVTAEDAQMILDYAENADNPYNIPISWSIPDSTKFGLSSPVIVGTDTFIAGKMKRTEHAEEAFGFSFEKVVLFAESIGVGTTWIAGTMNRNAFESAVGLGEGEVMPCVSPLGYPAKKMSVREAVMRKGIGADSRLDFGDLFFDGETDKPLSKEAAGKLAEVLEAVRLAPSAVNKQPWRVAVCEDAVHFYEKQSRGYDDGIWDLQKIDMGIALCHFELAAAQLGIDVKFMIKNPCPDRADGLKYIASYSVK
jgi:nitroreductase